jgi:transcriptional regulator with XRE-family HTH domain
MGLQATFIQNLKFFRKLCGFSQMALAQRCDTSANYIGQIEMGRRIPSFDKIEAIANALGIKSYLLFMDKPEEEKNKLIDTKSSLTKMPARTKQDVAKTLIKAINPALREAIDKALDPANY